MIFVVSSTPCQAIMNAVLHNMCTRYVQKENEQIVLEYTHQKEVKVKSQMLTQHKEAEEKR